MSKYNNEYEKIVASICDKQNRRIESQKSVLEMIYRWGELTNNKPIQKIFLEKYGKPEKLFNMITNSKTITYWPPHIWKVDELPIVQDIVANENKRLSRLNKDIESHNKSLPEGTKPIAKRKNIVSFLQLERINTELKEKKTDIGKSNALKKQWIKKACSQAYNDFFKLNNGRKLKGEVAYDLGISTSQGLTNIANALGGNAFVMVKVLLKGVHISWKGVFRLNPLNYFNQYRKTVNVVPNLKYLPAVQKSNIVKFYIKDHKGNVVAELTEENILTGFEINGEMHTFYVTSNNGEEEKEVLF